MWSLNNSRSVKIFLSLSLAAAFVAPLGFSPAVNAAPASDSSPASQIKMMMAPRYGVGGSIATVSNSTNRLVGNYEHPATVWQEASAFYPIGLRMGLREVFDQNASVQFNGGAAQRAEIYLSQIDLGVIAYLPIPIVQPWASVGLVGGTLAMTNPRTRSHDNWMAAFGDETSWIRGTYLAAGVDIMFSGKMGLRFSFQEDQIETNDFYNLSGTQMKFALQRYSLGIVSTL